MSVHTKDHAVKNFLSTVHFGHREDIHGHTLHGLVRYRCPLVFPLDILIVWIAGLSDQTTLLDLLNGIVETDLTDFEPALHVGGLLLYAGMHHVVVPSFTKLNHRGLWY